MFTCLQCLLYYVKLGHTVHVQQLKLCVELLRQERPDFIAPYLWPPNSPDLSPVDYEIWAVMQRRVYQRHIHSVDELKLRLIDRSGVVLNSRFLTTLLTSGEEDIEHVMSVLKEGTTTSTARELTMLISSDTLNVTCLITTSCQQRWPIHYCSFYKAVH